LSASLQEEGDINCGLSNGNFLVGRLGRGGGWDATYVTIRYAKIETIQSVWTHNCEHGVLRGTIEVDIIDIVDPLQIVPTSMPLAEVEFGPQNN
jgi:hypothetical protein